MRIEICGGIGTGKTSFARAITQEGPWHLIAETYRTVPYWEKYLENRKRYAFGKNISFLLSHGYAIEDEADCKARTLCDFSMFQDLAYAKLSCQEEDLPVIEAIYHRLIARIGLPSIVVRLTCSAATQLKRILQRGRIAERTITEKYLCSLRQTIDERVEQLIRPAGVVVLDVDTDLIDVSRREDVKIHAAMLIDLIRDLKIDPC